MTRRAAGCQQQLLPGIDIFRLEFLRFIDAGATGVRRINQKRGDIFRFRFRKRERGHGTPGTDRFRVRQSANNIGIACVTTQPQQAGCLESRQFVQTCVARRTTKCIDKPSPLLSDRCIVLCKMS